ncbi:hypothetical protein CRG98_022042 [Punica granatum]|uniref:Leucine-rich repeat-containing N-terminal plant-type domain-containing protein n=1 Tax=Punica granatum TaxID=22663 RepID=A0A2I0JMR2_PUNGR|nr:hypothetical protein CRG98_022042 [Punica granatum]
MTLLDVGDRISCSDPIRKAQRLGRDPMRPNPVIHEIGLILLAGSTRESLLVFEARRGLWIKSLHQQNSRESLTKTTQWEKGTGCCSWVGVTCRISTSYMIGFDLSCSWLKEALHSNSTLFFFPVFSG